MQVVLFLVGLLLIIIIWTTVEQKQLTVTKYTVISDKLPNAFDKTHFVVLADLHNYCFGNNNDKLQKRIESLAPEFILVAGDMINKKDACYPSPAYSLMEQLAKKYRIYYAYGNHEQRVEKLIKDNRPAADKDKKQENLCSTWIEFRKRLIDFGVIFLDNESTYIKKNHDRLRITGVSIGKEFFARTKTPMMEKGYLQSLIKTKEGNDYQILIAHNPVYFEEYAKWGADLTISGHLHGGLVRLPGIGGVISPQVKLFPKYNSGNFTENGQEMVVSRGLGSHSMMPRLFNTPEIVDICLNIK